MKLFFDENIGDSVPRALRDLGLVSIEYPGRRRRSRTQRSTSDIDILRQVGSGGYLFISKDMRILRVEAERRALIENSVGAIFLDSVGATKLQMMRVLLARWDWLDEIDRHEPRPFAFRLSMNNRVTRLDLR